jgi:hypothetical protein
MDTEDIDEHEPRRNWVPPALPPDATHEEMIAAINVLARAADSHALELQGVRVSIQELGTRIGTFIERIEKLMERVLGVTP